MPQKILLSADTPCDIGPQLQKRYGVLLCPLHIELGGTVYTDGKDISNEYLYRVYRERKLLPKTSAVNPEEYIAYFRPYVEDGYEILHISLGSGISCTHQNACIAAEELGHMHVIDSKNLSSGFGHLVCEAGERILAGMDVEAIESEVAALVPKVSASFVIDTLEFMHASGRCSNFSLLSANLMQIRPSIQVQTDKCGAMAVGKKYMGKLGHALAKYVEDQLRGRDDIQLDRAFITHTCPDDVLPERMREIALQYQPFHEVFITRASCTIGSHCGPGTLGILFLTK